MGQSCATEKRKAKKLRTLESGTPREINESAVGPSAASAFREVTDGNSLENSSRRDSRASENSSINSSSTRSRKRVKASKGNKMSLAKKSGEAVNPLESPRMHHTTDPSINHTSDETSSLHRTSSVASSTKSSSSRSSTVSNERVVASKAPPQKAKKRVNNHVLVPDSLFGSAGNLRSIDESTARNVPGTRVKHSAKGNGSGGREDFSSPETSLLLPTTLQAVPSFQGVSRPTQPVEGQSITSPKDDDEFSPIAAGDTAGITSLAVVQLQDSDATSASAKSPHEETIAPVRTADEGDGLDDIKDKSLEMVGITPLGKIDPLTPPALVVDVFAASLPREHRRRSVTLSSMSEKPAEMASRSDEAISPSPLDNVAVAKVASVTDSDATPSLLVSPPLQPSTEDAFDDEDSHPTKPVSSPPLEPEGGPRMLPFSPIGLTAASFVNEVPPEGDNNAPCETSGSMSTCRITVTALGDRFIPVDGPKYGEGSIASHVDRMKRSGLQSRLLSSSNRVERAESFRAFWKCLEIWNCLWRHQQSPSDDKVPSNRVTSETSRSPMLSVPSFDSMCARLNEEIRQVPYAKVLQSLRDAQSKLDANTSRSNDYPSENSRASGNNPENSLLRRILPSRDGDVSIATVSPLASTLRDIFDVDAVSAIVFPVLKELQNAISERPRAAVMYTTFLEARQAANRARNASVTAYLGNHNPDEVLPGIFIGSYHAVLNEEVMARYRIEAVVSCVGDLFNTNDCDKRRAETWMLAPGAAPIEPFSRPRPKKGAAGAPRPVRLRDDDDHDDENENAFFTTRKSVQYCNLELRDKATYRIDSHFETAVRFLRHHYFEERRNVLVVCGAGVSRASSIMCAFLCDVFGLDVLEALAMIRNVRPQIRPNDAFLFLLVNTYSPQMLGS